MSRHPGALTATYKPKICQHCGKKFTPQGSTAKFCGRICRDKAKKIRRSNNE